MTGKSKYFWGQRALVPAVAIGGLLAVGHGSAHAEIMVPFLDVPAVFQWVQTKATPEKFLMPALEFLLLLPLAFLIEAVAVGWHFCSLRRMLVRPSTSSRMDMLLYALFLLRLPRMLTAPLAFIGFTGLALLGNGMLAEAAGIADWTRIEDPILGVAVFWLVRDFGYYWYHRLQHTKAFWPLHRMHHGATHMNVLTVYRNNFFSDILIGHVMMVPLAFFTLPEASIFAGQLLLVFHGYLIHSEWRAKWGWVGSWIFQAPLHHRLHHGLREIEGTKNFGTLPIWDRIFGTFAEPETRAIRIGVTHDGYGSVGACILMLFKDVAESARCCWELVTPRGPALAVNSDNGDAAAAIDDKTRA
jgi:sterol desaturase/sphingolipid hydroxylase (fatty acid hydroxylase superfamily)